MFRVFFGRFKAQIMALLAVALISSWAWSVVTAYNAGRNANAMKDLKIISDYQQKMATLQERINDDERKAEIKTNKIIKVIRQAPDATGCADTNIPDDIMLQLDDS